MDESCDRLLKVKKSCNIAPGVVDLSVVEDENYIKGGILSNPKLSWVSCGPRLTNLDNNNGSKKTGWTFGWAAGDNSVRVVCVEELPGCSATSPVLVVGCDGDHGSSLCFYHSGCSRVLKAVHFSDKITSLAVVSKSNDVEENLSELLRPWNGLVAVGTNVGKVYLVDVWWRALERCIEDFRHKLYDEQRQSKLIEVTIRDLENDVDLRTSNIRHGSSSLGLWLNEVTYERGRRGPHPGVDNILGRMPLEFLAVTALEYFPQISTLAVGYNTSCFQLWDLSSLQLLYTSALLEAMLPVFSFSLLEPSDDPRYVCYLWSLHHSVDEDSIPFAGMYIISYQEKHQKQYNNQFFYEGFSSCSIRYQLDLGAEMTDIASGRIISCQSIHRSTSKSSALWIEPEAEETSSEEGTASLLTIAWEVWTPNQLTVYRKLTLFDLNQWYREYMPTSSDMEYSQFMAHFCLPDGPLLDVKVIPSSVKQFQALQPLDEHFYPTATSFDCLLLQQSQLVVCSHSGVQQEALEALTEAGPSGLLLPARLYKQCMTAGLRPLLTDMGGAAMQSNDQRAYLLCVALEHEMTQFLRRCAADWADGSHAVAGCTLPGLLGWAWDRVQRYKKWLDRLCVPLFDYSGAALDTNDMGIFHHMICQLHRLHDLFCLVLEKYSSWIIRGNFEQQYTVINLVTAFYDSVFWCVRNKVLPEVNASEANINGCIPYFTDKIINATITRRAELHQLARTLRDPPPSPPGLLLIDAVIAEQAGARVTDQWEREGGSSTLGKYPPPSVQSLLRTYLIRGVPAQVKHFLVTYFLLDVAHVLCSLGGSETTKRKLLKYPTDFGLTESQSKIVEAFWCLDHKQFQSGVDLLLDSCVDKEDLQVYQHRIVLCLLAAVGEHKLALNYLTSRRRTPIEPQDVRMEMTLLLRNDLIHEAFQFQRHHQSLSAELLGDFFKGCLEMNKLDVIFKLALTPAEEEAFMAFLDKTSHPQADDIRVLYLLSRSRYVEAIDMNERLRSAAGLRRGMGLAPVAGQRNTSRGGGAPVKTLTTRDLIINSVSKSLPSITRDLADYCHKEKHFSWKQINRPTPLSVVVHTELSNDRLPYYKTTDSQLIQAAVSKTREIWAPLLATPAALKRKLQTTVEDTPFLRNPIHSRLNSSVANIEEVRSGVRSRTDDEESKAPKKARLEFSPSEKESTQTEKTVDKTAEMDITCLESNAVLHTPLVARIVKKPPKEINTPQSILKGKSGPNTPLTPARERLGSPAVNRQIRFSLPQEESSPSPTKSEEDEHSDGGDYLKTTLSPRKSIHETSDLHSRLPTPSNPRVLQKMLSHSLRSSATRLKFDEPETPPAEEVKEEPEPSATAVTLLKKISSSPSSEETYFSLQSDSSGVQIQSDGEERFKISYGLEGNIDEEVIECVPEDNTYVEDREENPDVSYESDMSVKELETSEIEYTITPSKSRFSLFSGIASAVSADQTSESIHLTLEDDEIHSNSLQRTNQTLPQSVMKTQEKKEGETNKMGVTITPSKSRFSGVESAVCINQTNESIHLTLEYEEDTPSRSLHKIDKTMSESKNIPHEITNDRDDVAVEAQKYVLLDVEMETEREEKTEDVTMSETTPTILKEQEIVIDTVKGEILQKEISQESPLPCYENGENKIEKYFKLDEVEGTFTLSSALPSEEGSESIDQQIDLEESVVQKRLDEHVLPTQDSTLASIRSFTNIEQDIEEEPINSSNEGLESSIKETALRSVRGSTPLPQILEELVKKGRISLKSPESKTDDEVNPLCQEKDFSNEADTSTNNFPICDISEEFKVKEVNEVTVNVQEENEVQNGSGVNEVTVDVQEVNEVQDGSGVNEVTVDVQEENEVQNESGVNADEIKDPLTSEVNNYSKKDFSFTLAPNNSNICPSFQQTFVFGNQASLSTAAANINLTFTVGANQFGSTFETEELSSSKLDPNKTKDECVYRPEDDKDIPRTTAQTESESQVCTTSEEPTTTTEINSDEAHPVLETHSITVEEFNEEEPISEMIIANIASTNSAKTSNVFTSDLPEDDQNQVLDFFVDTAGSAYTKQLEADSTADFELKMSEGESMMEISGFGNNEVSASGGVGVQEEPVFQTLRPVNYNIEEDNCYFQPSEKENEEDEEVDIYGDLDKEEDVEDLDESMDLDRECKNEEEGEKEVICLGSSSDEESPIKMPKSSTPYNRQLTPKATKRTEIFNETLDYEGEEEELEEEQEEYGEEEEEENNESYSSESSSDDEHEQSEKDESDSKIEKKNLYFSSESDSDTSHHRRSWKEQRKQNNSNESLIKETTDEDTVESPPFELIGQESQEESKEKLETIIEEPKVNSPEVTSSKSLSSPPKEINSVKVEVHQGKKDVDIIKLAEESRQRRIETGSILDLKKRRSKRYSSATDLNGSQKIKLRRRSCSLHDFMSAFIKETKSSSQSSPEKESEKVSGSSTENVGQVSSPECTADEFPSPKKSMPSFITQTSVTSELEFSETGSVTSSLLPEIGSLASNQTSIADFTISTVPKPFDGLKKKVKSFASRLSSLHDISEEISENAESMRCTPQNSSAKTSMRRSSSTGQLPVSTQTDDSRVRRSSSVCKWSEYAKAHASEITSDSADTAGSDNMGDTDVLDNHSKSERTQKKKYATRKSNQKILTVVSLNDPKINTRNEEDKCVDAKESVTKLEQIEKIQKGDTSKTEEMVKEDVSNFTDTSKVPDTGSISSSRWLRAQSEPSSISLSTAGNKRSRRSSSTLKINEHHKRILYRSSLRGKSIEPQEFKIIDSDAESPDVTLTKEDKIETDHVQLNEPSKEETLTKEDKIETDHVQLNEPSKEETSTKEDKIETDHVQSNEPSKEETIRNNLTNDQFGVPAETTKPVEVLEISPKSEAKRRAKRGHSEPPAVKMIFPRTRRSSFSQKIEKVNKIVFHSHIRKSRANSFQPMEIVHSDEDGSFQKTPDVVNEHFESEQSDQGNKDTLETPVTTKKRRNLKKQPKRNDETAADETKMTEPSSPGQEDHQANKNTQDYPQPPKKRGRQKHKPEEVIPDTTEFESDQHNIIARDSQSNKDNLTIEDNSKVTKLQGKKKSEKVDKVANKVVKNKENETSSDDEPLTSFIKKGSESDETVETANMNKKKGLKKQKGGVKVNIGQKNEEVIPSVNYVSEEPGTEIKSKSKRKNINDDHASTPKKTLKRKNTEVSTPPNEQSDNENVESSLTESQADEMAKAPKLSKEQELLMLDSPARRTRRSMSRMSDTEMLTPVKEKPQRRTRRNSVKSDVGLSTPKKYAESDISDVSTEINLRLNTPTRRSTRRTSISNTPNTPDLIPEEFLMQRRLTRHQHSQLQKSFELSFAESPRLSRLEEVPEESGESNELSLTPIRASKRSNKAAVSKGSKSKSKK